MWDVERFGQRPEGADRPHIDRDAEVQRYQDPWAPCWRIPELDDYRGLRALVEEYCDTEQGRINRWHYVIEGRGHGYPTRYLGKLLVTETGLALEAVPGADPLYTEQ